MTVSQLHGDAITSGVITFEEIHWLARNRDLFTPLERQMVTGLVRFLQQGVINPGCRLTDHINPREVRSAELQAV
jgi:hypothetical protein